MKELAWEEVSKALEHYQSLNVLKIAARNSDKLILFTEEQDARGALLQQLPLRLRKITSFV